MARSSCWARSSACRSSSSPAASGWRWLLAPIPIVVLGVLIELLFLRPLYRRGHMDQVLLTFGFTFVFFDLVQTLWGRVVLRLPAPEALQGIGADRPRRVLGLPAVPDRIRLRHRAAAMAVSRAQPHRRHGARRCRQRRDGGRPRRQHPGLLFTGIFGFGVALAALGGIAAGPCSASTRAWTPKS